MLPTNYGEKKGVNWVGANKNGPVTTPANSEEKGARTVFKPTECGGESKTRQRCGATTPGPLSTE